MADGILKEVPEIFEDGEKSGTDYAGDSGENGDITYAVMGHDEDCLLFDAFFPSALIGRVVGGEECKCSGEAPQKVAFQGKNHAGRVDFESVEVACDSADFETKDESDESLYDKILQSRSIGVASLLDSREYALALLPFQFQAKAVSCCQKSEGQHEAEHFHDRKCVINGRAENIVEQVGEVGVHTAQFENTNINALVWNRLSQYICGKFEDTLMRVMTLWKPVRHIIIFLAIGTSAVSAVRAQTGANVQGGLSVMRNASQQVTGSEHEVHSGFFIGLNGRFGSYTWYLSPGAYYYRLDILSDEEVDFFGGKERITMVKIPIDLGARLIRTPVFNFRLYAGGVINYIESVDENAQNITIDRYNDIHFGLNAGVGMDFWWLTLDLRYEKGLSGILIDDGQAKSDYLSAGVGIFF